MIDPERMIDPEKIQDRYVDVLKHMTTLGAGAVVLISTFMSDIFPKDKDGTLALTGFEKALLGLSMLCFGLTVFCAVTVLFSFVFRYVLEVVLPDRTIRWFTGLVLYAFFFGIAIFANLVVRTVVLSE
jgi:hypothetical protein